MLAKLRPRSAYDVMAALALFVALTTGGAYATHLVVDSSDVVDDSLTGSDVRGKAGTGTTHAVNGSLTTHDVAGQQADPGNGTPFNDGTLTQWDIKNGAIAGADIAGNAITSGKVANNTLSGTDIDESTLGQVPSALVGGHGRYAGRGTCNPQFAVFNTCAVVSLDIPAGLPRVHVIGVAVADQGSVAQPEANGRCRVATSRGSIPDSEVFVMVDTALELMPLTVVAITGPLSPGPVAFAIECNEEDPDISYRNVGVTAVVLAPN